MLPHRGAARLLGHSARPSMVPRAAALHPHHGLSPAILRPALAPNAPSRRTFITLPPIIEPLAETLTSLQVSTGLPWYLLIPSVALVHTALFAVPVRPRELRLAARNTLISPLATAWFHKTRNLGVSNPEDAARKQIKRMQSDLGVNTLRVIGPRLLIYFPTWFTLGNTFRHIAASGDASFAAGGCLWFQDLAAADPYYILPTLMGAGMLYTHVPRSMSEVQELFDPAVKSFAIRSRRAFLVLAPIIAYLISSSPAGALLFWATSIGSARIASRLVKRFVPPVSKSPWVSGARPESWFVNGPR